MTYFFNQNKIKTKSRTPIRIEDVSGKIKIVNIDSTNETYYKDTKNKPDFGVPTENNDQNEKLIKIEKIENIKTPVKKLKSTSDSHNLSKIYSKLSKESASILQELAVYLDDAKCTIKLTNIWSSMTYDSLRENVEKYLSTKRERDSQKLDINVSDRKSPQKERRLAKEKRASLNSNLFNAPDVRQSHGTVQFQLSCEKYCEWLQDENHKMKLAAIEWGLTKLRCTRNRSAGQLSSRLPSATKNQFINIDSKKAVTVDYYTDKAVISPLIFDDLQMNQIFYRLSAHLSQISEAISTNNKLKVFICSISNVNKTLYYPSGEVAILYFNQCRRHCLLVFDTDTKLIATFISSFNGTSWIGWPQSHYLRVVLNNKMCQLFTPNNVLTRHMKWPQNSNNKLPYTISIKLNDFLSFYCAGRNDIFLKFDAVNKITNSLHSYEFALHKWLFDSSSSSSSTLSTLIKKESEPPVQLLSNVNFSSKFSQEINKTNAAKSQGKNDVLTDENEDIFLDKLHVELTNTSKQIRDLFQKWIKYIQLKLQIPSVPPVNSIKRESRSAVFSRDRFHQSLNKYDQQYPPSDYIPRAITTIPGNRKSFTGSKDSIKKLPVTIICPIKLRASVYITQSCSVNSRSNCINNQFDGAEYELSEMCLCNKYDVPEITDKELPYYLAQVNPTVMVVLAIISSRTELLQKEAYSKEELLERSLYTLISDVYQEDIKKSTSQKPCIIYSRKQYRLFIYDIKNSGKYTESAQSWLLKNNKILPGMCLMFRNNQLLFADFIFNGYTSTKKDLFKQILISKSDQERGFFIPNDFLLSYDYASKNWMSENAFSKIIMRHTIK